jgi:hypothetical protein
MMIPRKQQPEKAIRLLDSDLGAFKRAIRKSSRQGQTVRVISRSSTGLDGWKYKQIQPASIDYYRPEDWDYCQAIIRYQRCSKI